MNNTFRIYPIGIQSFEDLRNNNNVYVDKTELIYRLANTNKVYFLSRPRLLREKFAGFHFGRLFSGKKRLVPRIGNGTFGERMECLSGAAHRFQHDEIYHYG